MSLALRELMRPLIAELEHPFFSRGGMLFPAIGNAARTMAARRPTVFNVRESDKEVIVEAETPGYSKDNLSVAVEGNRLVIKGAEQKGKEGDEMFEREEFMQAFELPKELAESKISAAYRDGVLRVTMLKPETIEPKTVPIAIEEGSAPASDKIPIGEAKGTTEALS